MVRPLAARRGIKIECDLPAIKCLGDPDRLSHVVTNLLTNPNDFYRDQGQIRLSVDAENSSARLKVADTGEGIPAEDGSRSARVQPAPRLVVLTRCAPLDKERVPHA